MNPTRCRQAFTAIRQSPPLLWISSQIPPTGGGEKRRNWGWGFWSVGLGSLRPVRGPSAGPARPWERPGGPQGGLGARLRSSPRGIPRWGQRALGSGLRTFEGASTQPLAGSAQVIGQAQCLISGTPSPSSSLHLPSPSIPPLNPRGPFFLG